MTFPLMPHGGAGDLQERLAGAPRAEEVRRAAPELPRIGVADHHLWILHRLGDATLSPLRGPMTRSILDQVLATGTVECGGRTFAWGAPILLPVTDAEALQLRVGGHAHLADSKGQVIALLEVEDLFAAECRLPTKDPGTQFVGGTIHVLPWNKPANIVGKHAAAPRETRARLAATGWDAAIACFTDAHLFRADEYRMVAAVEQLAAHRINAGVFLIPTVDETNPYDVATANRLQAHEVLKTRGLLGAGDTAPEVWRDAPAPLGERFEILALDVPLPLAGTPQAVLMRAIAAQNHGFTHLLVTPEEAAAFVGLQGELLIKPLVIGEAAFDERLGRCALKSDIEARGGAPLAVDLAVLDRQLENGEHPDPRILRPEIADVLIEGRRRNTAVDRHVFWHAATVTHEDRETLNGHKGATLWFTGLSGSGKSTVANAVAGELHRRGVRTYVLDGDNIRTGLNKDLTFSDADRVENIRRIGEVAKLFTDAGIVNLSAFISPFAADRKIAADLQPSTFLEVYCEADLATCEQRDPKGLYKKARAGEIRHFTGIGSPYEPPENPAIRVNTSQNDLQTCVAIVLGELERRGIIPRR